MLDLRSCKLIKPRLVAVARDSHLSAKVDFQDGYLPVGCVKPDFGQDISYALNRIIPYGEGVGKNELELKNKMRKLVEIFSGNENKELTLSLFDNFLGKNKEVEVFNDPRLDFIAKNHKNIKSFCNLAISAPGYNPYSPGKVRIHQALKKADWNINNLQVPVDLGVPAFNIGSKAFSTEDFGNGLGVMINGVQHVYVFAKEYFFDSISDEYRIVLEYVFYDVFGLDDDDLVEYGAKSDGVFESNARVGITAWWQLQHQYGYAPLVTRFSVLKEYKVSTK